MRDIIYLILQRECYKRCLVRGGRYRAIFSREEIERFQKEQFNRIWRDAFTNIPLYRKWKTEHQLPDSIGSLLELQQWPVITKKELQLSPELLVRPGVRPTGQVLTGGSTGEPMRFGTWKDEDTSPSIWLAKAAYGILPGDRTFHLWGHSHLYGHGIKRKVKIAQQHMKDYFSNRFRFPAYDLSVSAMRSAFDCCNRFQPVLFSGFSAAVLAFCRVNHGRKLASAPKALLCTAGPLSAAERREICDFFDAPLSMEYGSADCSDMAHTIPETGRYRVFWDTHLLQGIIDEFREVKNIVTRLTPCYFPIIRYDIGDYLELEKIEHLESILEMESVKGRPSDIVHLDNGVSFFSAAVADCVKQIPSVLSVQLVPAPGLLKIMVVAMKPLLEKEKELILLRLNAIIGNLGSYPVAIFQVDNLWKTPAGKIPLVKKNDD